MELTIMDLYEGYKVKKKEYEKIYKYYVGETDAILTYTQTDRSNLKVNTNYIKKFVKEETAYSVGNPITYQSKSKNNEAIEGLDGILENFKENHDINVFKNMVLTSKTYEIYFIDKWDSLQAKAVKPTEAFHMEDDEGSITDFIYVYSRTEIKDGELKPVTYIDRYTENEIIFYKLEDDKATELERINHIFGEIPVGFAQISEEDYKDTIYNDIKGLQDALETNLSDITNEISDFRNAYLTLTGLSLEEDDATRFKSNGIIEIPTAEGRAEWLIKNINDTFIQNTLKALQEKIYELTSHINHNDSDGMSNASGIALKSRLISLTQRCKINEGAFRELLKTRIRIIFTWLATKERKNYDWKDIQAKFTALIPNDDQLTADLIQKLDGKLSAETGLNLLSFVENGQEEYKKAQEEISNNDLPFGEEPEFNVDNELEEEEEA